MKKILIWISLFFLGGGGTIGITTPLLIANKHADIKTKKSSYIDRNMEIMEEIKNYNTQTLFKNAKLEMKNYMKKTHILLFLPIVLSRKTAEKTWKCNTKINLTHNIKNKEISFHFYDKFRYLWTDILSHDKLDILKNWDKEVELEIPHHKKNFKLNILHTLNFIDCYSFEFKNDNTWSYLQENYWYKLYAIWNSKVESKYYYRYDIDTNENLYILNNKISKIWDIFTEEINLSDSNKIYNEKDINYKNTMRFNDNFSTLFEIRKIHKIYDELNKKEYNTFNEKKFIKEIEEYSFSSYEELEKRYKYLQETGNTIPIHNNFYNLNQRVNKLLNDIRKKSKISINNDINTLCLLYHIVINFFASNEIELDVMFNNEPLKINLWKNRSFVNTFKEFPKNLQTGKNYQTLETHYLNVKNVGKNNVFLFSDESYFKNKKYNINYRWDAVFRNPKIYKVSSNGIIISTNKLLSDLIHNNSFIDNRYILNKINTKISNECIFDEIKLISNNNWNDFSKNININALNNFFNLNLTTDNFNYISNDYNGTFFVMAKIKNTHFDDDTTGDFKDSFISNMIKLINYKYNNIFHAFDHENDSYFILKIQNNKIKL